MKVCFIQRNLEHYRYELFSNISKYFEVSVIHFGKKKTLPNQISFIQINYDDNLLISNLKTYLKIIRSSYDVLIIGDDLKYIFFPLFRLITFGLGFNKKIVWWGVGGKNLFNFFGIFKNKIYFKNDSLVFYDYSTFNKYLNKFSPIKKNCYVINNSIKVGKNLNFQNSLFKILNVGSLTYRKRNDILIKCIANVFNDGFKNIRLEFIGSGKAEHQILNKIKHYNMDKIINLSKEINDPELLSKYYEESIVSISYGQAGLTVLQSFGFSRPFITSKYSVSGGEKSNIIHGFNGFFVNSQNDLQDLLKYLIERTDVLLEMGKNAKNTYDKQCSFHDYIYKFKNLIELANKL